MVLVRLHNVAQQAAVLILDTMIRPLLQYNQPSTQHISLATFQLAAT